MVEDTSSFTRQDLLAIFDDSLEDEQLPQVSREQRSNHPNAEADALGSSSQLGFRGCIAFQMKQLHDRVLEEFDKEVSKLQSENARLAAVLSKPRFHASENHILKGGAGITSEMELSSILQSKDAEGAQPPISEHQQLAHLASMLIAELAASDSRKRRHSLVASARDMVSVMPAFQAPNQPQENRRLATMAAHFSAQLLEWEQRLLNVAPSGVTEPNIRVATGSPVPAATVKPDLLLTLPIEQRPVYTSGEPPFFTPLGLRLDVSTDTVGKSIAEKECGAGASADAPVAIEHRHVSVESCDTFVRASCCTLSQEADRSRASRQALAALEGVDRGHPISRREESIAQRLCDPVMGAVIILNTITIGITNYYPSGDDIKPSKGWFFVELGFTGIFTFEMVMKLWNSGLIVYLFGNDYAWNLFDSVIVVLAIVESVLNAFTNLSFAEVRVLKVFRLLRLARVVRLVRAFKELNLMVHGLIEGLRTLFWAFVLLCSIVFILGVVLTQTLGQPPLPGHAETLQSRSRRIELFGDIARSMFTSFRCFTDGCTDLDGTPLMKPFIAADNFNYLLVGGYCLVSLIIIFGVFNLIMAVFVETTMRAAKSSGFRSSHARQKEKQKLALKLHQVVRLFSGAQVAMESQSFTRRGVNRLSSGRLATHRFERTCARFFGQKSLEVCPQEAPKTDSEIQSMFTSTLVTRFVFDQMLDDPQAHELLEEMGLEKEEWDGLFDSLDADGNGYLTCGELISGLFSLRGEPKRSDIVATRLSVRSTQNALHEFQNDALRNQRFLQQQHVLVSEALARLESILVPC